LRGALATKQSSLPFFRITGDDGVPASIRAALFG
jgi:hypothetical protein